jgi:multidrug efflux pump subunit AcrA (membrane-fusion protein)
VLVLVLIGGSYWGYTAIAAGNGGTEYVLGTVTRGPLDVTVTASGQVDSQDTLNLTPQGSASGQITYIGVTPGETVKAGQLIATLDMTTAEEAVTSAKQDLESAEISYQQTLTSSGSSVTNDQSSLSTDQTNDLNALATTYANLPTVMTGLDGILHNLSTIPNFTAEENVDAYRNYLNTSESQMYQEQVQNDYIAALEAYQNVQSEYSAADPSSLSVTQIQQLNSDTISADKAIETALKDSLNYYTYVDEQVSTSRVTMPSQLTSQISSLTSYQSTVTGDDTSITSAQTALTNDEQSITADTESLGNSSQPLTVQSAELNVQKAQESLAEAETTESDYEVRAPFDGVIATVPVNQYDQASSGTTIATLITTEEYVDLSLNEADAAKVVVGQPVSITFDALPSLTMTGSVATIDPVGTVTSGVVTYDVKVSFSQQNSSVKPGMTAEAVITTASEANAIQVPSAAVTTTGTFSTVKVATLLNASSTLAALGATSASGTKGTGTHRTRTASSTSAYAGFGGAGAYASSSSSTRAFASSTAMSGSTPMVARSLTVPASEVTIKVVPVTVGISNDTMTEIVSGLTPGEYVVTATQSATANTTKTAAASATSLLGGSTSRTGAGGFGGGTGGYTGARAGGATGGGAAAAK